MNKLVPIIDRDGLERVRKALRIDPQQMRRLRTQFFKKFVGRDEALEQIPGEMRHVFAALVDFHPLELEVRHDSRIDGASKLIWRTRGGGRVESVILRADTGRTTLCLSSQVGCAAACDFCATGKMGFGANLSAAEIVDQIVQAGQLVAGEDRTIRNIVLMGMGEPFHNEPQVFTALESLFSGELFNHPASRVLISTVGIPDGMLRCAERFPDVHLALSLHAVRQDVRESLIPLAKKYPLEALRETLVELNRRQKSPVMLEYLMLQGINDSSADAEELIAFAQGLRVHLNLIPFNPIEAAPDLAGSDRPTRDRFANQLKRAGLTTTIRYSMGADIDAACGQLVQRLERRRKSSTVATPS